MEPLVALGIDGVTKVTTDGVARHALGQKATVAGVDYMYVKTTGALVKYTTYVIDENYLVGAGIANSIDKPIALGAPQVTVAAPSGVTYNYCWVAVGGNGFYVLCDASVPKDVIVALGSTAGQIASAVAGYHTIPGMRIVSTVGSVAGSYAAAFCSQQMFAGEKL